jgi:hypothetical protein
MKLMQRGPAVTEIQSCINFMARRFCKRQLRATVDKKLKDFKTETHYLLSEQNDAEQSEKIKLELQLKKKE